MMTHKVDIDKLKAVSANKFRSIRELCKASGIPEGTLYSTIRRNGSLQEGAILRLAKALGTTPDTFSDMDINSNPVNDFFQDEFYAEVHSVLEKLTPEGRNKAMEQITLISMIPEFRRY